MLMSETMAPSSLGEIQFRSVKSFIASLYTLVSDPSIDHIVRWSLGNNTFVILDREKFSNVILPQYFKHANFASFIKQLNIYQFQMMNPHIKHVDPVFYHPSFQKGQKNLLYQIKRRYLKSEIKKSGDIILESKTPVPKCPVNKDFITADYSQSILSHQKNENELLDEETFLKFLKQRVTFISSTNDNLKKSIIEKMTN